jgi:V/A-type H+-transporting ATPase subunit I
MIVRMKKITLIVLDEKRNKVLHDLRKLGILHIYTLQAESERLEELHERKSYLEKALRMLPSAKKPGKVKETEDSKQVIQVAESIFSMNDKLTQMREEYEKLGRTKEMLLPWGDFDPADLDELRGKGVNVRLYDITAGEYEKIAADIECCIIQKIQNRVRFITIEKEEENTISFDAVILPESGLADIEAAMKSITQDIQECEQELLLLSQQRKSIEVGITRLSHDIEFETIREGMGKVEELCYLTGFLPVDKVETIKKAASGKGWGLMIEDPSEDDDVPTLIKNSKWVRIINPVFHLLGTVPGYKEYDISLWFLLFFSIFFAMIIGDAGYGFIILIGTVIARIALKKVPANIVILFGLLSFCTIIWGAITGTWFGYDKLTTIPPFSWFIIPSITSFPGPENTYNIKDMIMFICFTLAVIQLTIAHIISFFKKIPLLKAFADIGKIFLLWGLYLLILNIVLKKDLPPFTIWLIVIGFILNFVFVEQEGNFIKGLLSSLKNIIPITLNSIGSFSDIISYVRLFAVGLAAVKVAEAFNNIAASVGFGSPVAFIGTLLIIVVGHSFNIVMSGMSVIVHGIRLNMLEFSGHLGMEWSGGEYKPFQEYSE